MQSVTIEMKDEKLLLTLNEAARALSLSVWTLRAWAQQGQLPTVKVGARRLVRAEIVKEISERGLA